MLRSARYAGEQDLSIRCSRQGVLISPGWFHASAIKGSLKKSTCYACGKKVETLRSSCFVA